MAHISDSDAFKLRHRISFDSIPFELKGYFLFPMAFSDCVFHFQRYCVKINLKKILKEWVSIISFRGFNNLFINKYLVSSSNVF